MLEKNTSSSQRQKQRNGFAYPIMFTFIYIRTLMRKVDTKISAPIAFFAPPTLAASAVMKNAASYTKAAAAKPTSSMENIAMF